MKIKLFAVLAVVTSTMLVSCGTGQLKGQKLKTGIDSVSYAFGIYNYNALMRDSLFLNSDLVARGMKDAMNETQLWDEDEAYGVIMIYLNERNQRRMQAMAEANKANYKEHIELNERFLAENKNKPGVITTASGLQYEVIRMGNGPMPTNANSVRVHYTGMLIDGTVFDSSVERGEPAEFGVPYVIQGWVEALHLMPVGSVFKLFIPENLAYGADGGGDVIMPYSTLIFEVELLAIVR
jgi:FKBP-type peptidyl-prolyl cis-trans isomerase FklB